MQSSVKDVWVGLFVLLGALALLFLSLQSANLLQISWQPTYQVTARFDNIGGLRAGATVRSAGVPVGRVQQITFNDQTFQADVTLLLEQRYAFPSDSSFQILTSGLLGEQYVGIVPGGADENLADGATVTLTQSAIVLENLIGQFLFNRAADSGADGAAARQ
ncbi:MAG: outer membrane lipid asymmetry maintenance protein MlaD [Pseudomonadota bacterium]|jgi:phospholipid/cholesterol/gamma-HCH transport system substrate-binding protein